MPTYIHDGSSWKEVDGGVPTQTMTGDNIYVRTSGSGSVDQTRILGVDIHDGITWRNAYTAYVTQPPTAPSKPTIASGASFNSNVYYLSVSWGTSTPSSGSTIQSYTLERKDIFGNVFTTTYSSSSRDSGLISINPGSTYKFRVKATASNSAGTADSPWSNVLEARAGQENVAFSRSGTLNHLFTRTPPGSCLGVGDYYSVSKSGSSANSAVPGYVNVTKAIYQLNTLTTSVSIASQTRSLICSGPGIYQVFSYPAYGTNTPVTLETDTYGAAGGGTYAIQAVGTDSGNGWPSHNTSTCALNSSALVRGNLTISGVETTSNAVTNTNGTW